MKNCGFGKGASRAPPQSASRNTPSRVCVLLSKPSGHGGKSDTRSWGVFLSIKAQRYHFIANYHLGVTSGKQLPYQKCPPPVPGPGQAHRPSGPPAPRSCPGPAVRVLYVKTQSQNAYPFLRASAEPGTALAPGTQSATRTMKEGHVTESEGRWSRQASLGGDLGHQK